MQNPDFLINNPDLYSILTPPDRSEGDRIVDFQNIMIEKIKKNLKDLQHNQGHLIDTSRNNLTTQAQVHEAVLCLLETEALNHIGHIVTQDWADMLHIDVIRICFEVDHPINPPALKEITLLQKGRVNEYLNQEDIILLRGEANVSEDIFGPAKPLVKTEALIKIPKTKYNPPGILAFGSRDLDMFYPGQGTELLRFLGKSYHKCMIQWLKQ
tara:strand:- start:152 stop:787 length:636 start_codon:yes stop_codon:yes gene_type:complete